MASKKQSYDAYLRQQIGSLIDQLQLPDLYKQSLKERWLDQMIWADKKADQCRRLHYRLRLTAIVGGVILPALVGISVQLGQDSKFFRVWFPPLTFTLSQIIAISVAVEEFCKFGDRWRDYRKLAEDLKSEGWQYLQSCGAYESGNSLGQAPMPALAPSVNSRISARLSLPPDPVLNGATASKGHLQNYAKFANRVESIIKDDVQSYISDLMQQQAKQDAEAQKILAQAQAVTSNKTIIAELDPNYRNPNAPPPAQAAPATAPPNTVATPGASFTANGPNPLQSMAAIASMAVPATPGPLGILKTLQDTVFKLSPQPSDALPDTQKVRVNSGSNFGLLAYKTADNNHLYVTFNQGLGVENRNTWFVYAPHVQMIGSNGQPIVPLTPANSSPANPSPTKVANSGGGIQLPVPYLSQLDNAANPYGSCNVTSIAMCLSYLGVKQKNPQKQFEDELQDWLEERGLDRHSPQDLAQAVQAYGCQDNFSANATLAQVKQWLDQGNPAVTHGYFTSSGHIVCVIGYNEKGLIVHDPYGEWTASGYVCNDSANPERGKALTYSYAMIQDTCMTGGQFWIHFISRPGFQPAAATTAQRPGVAAISLSAPAATTAQVRQWVTAEQLIQIAGSSGNTDRLRQFAPAVNQTFETYQINTPLRIAHFLAQVMHESGGFHYVREIWGPTVDQSAYEGRADLGNTQPGDGKRFMGRGLIQLTGRTNYEAFSKAINVDCVSNPELVEQMPYAVLAAGWFWNSKNLNSLADQDDVEAVTRRVNGGLYGIDERIAYLQAAKSVLGLA